MPRGQVRNWDNRVFDIAGRTPSQRLPVQWLQIEDFIEYRRQKRSQAKRSKGDNS